jgi:hypothetical protein
MQRKLLQTLWCYTNQILSGSTPVEPRYEGRSSPYTPLPGTLGLPVYTQKTLILENF